MGINVKSRVIAVNYHRSKIEDKYFIWPIIIGSLISVLLLIFVDFGFALFTGFIVVILSVIWLKKLKPIQKKLKYLEEWKIPSHHLQQLSLVFPSLTMAQKKWIVDAFKDYLAIHLWNPQHLAMPSQVVDQLWHSLLSNPVTYQEMCFKILGRPLKHIEYHQHTLSDQEKNEAFFQAWYLSCTINMLNPRTTVVLPRLFAVDYVVGIKKHPEHQLRVYLSDFKNYLRENNKSTCGGSSNCSSCGGD